MSDKKERIILDVAYQPQVRTKTDTRRLMLDVIIALIPAIIVGVLQFGVQVLLIILTSVCSAVFWEWAYRRLFKKEASIGDLSAVLTGLLLALTMPPTAPWWLPVVGTFFAIVIVKQLYGGIGKNFLNPALAGRAFLFSSYATIMATWSIPNALSGTVDGVTMATPLSGMYGDGLPAYFTVKSMCMGYLPGCIGEISAFALLLGGAYLIWRKVISWRIPVAFIGTVGLLTLIFGKSGYGNGQWMLMNLFSGSLFLGAFFMATDTDRLRRFISTRQTEDFYTRLSAAYLSLKHTIGKYLRAYLLIMLITFAELTLGFFCAGINLAFDKSGIRSWICHNHLRALREARFTNT